MEFEIKKDITTNFIVNIDETVTFNVKNESNNLNINFVVNEDQTIEVTKLKEIVSPKTGDNIIIALLIGGISVIVILICLLIFKKNK